MGEPFFCQLRPCQMKTSKRQVVYQRGYDSTGHNTNVPYWNLLTRRNQAKPAVLLLRTPRTGAADCFRSFLYAADFRPPGVALSADRNGAMGRLDSVSRSRGGMMFPRPIRFDEWCQDRDNLAEWSTGLQRSGVRTIRREPNFSSVLKFLPP